MDLTLLRLKNWKLSSMMPDYLVQGKYSLNLFCIRKENLYTFSGDNALKVEKGSTLRGKKSQRGSKFFRYGVDPFQNGLGVPYSKQNISLPQCHPYGIYITFVLHEYVHVNDFRNRN